MDAKTPDQWASEYYYENLGLTTIPVEELRQEYTLSKYVEVYLIPLYLVCTSETADNVQWDVLQHSYDEIKEYLESLPLRIPVNKMEMLLSKLFNSKCWMYCLVDILKAYDASCSNVKDGIEKAVNIVLENYVKTVVSFDIRAKNVDVYLHKITKKPIGIYPVELVALNVLNDAKRGQYTLREIANKVPTKLTTAERRIVIQALHLCIMSQEDLCTARILMPVGKELKYVEVNAISPNLPPDSVLRMLEAMDGYLVNKYGDAYKALSHYVSISDPAALDPDILLFMESIKDYVSDPDEKHFENDLNDISDSDLLSYIQTKLNLPVASLSDLTVKRELCDSDVISYINTKHNRNIKNLRECLRDDKERAFEYIDTLTSSGEISKKCTVYQLLQFMSTGMRQEPVPYSDADLLDQAAKQLGTTVVDLRNAVNSYGSAVSEEDVLRYLRTTCNVDIQSIQDLNKRSYDEVSDKKERASRALLDYIKGVLSVDRSADSRISILPLTNIVSVMLTCADDDTSAKVACEIHLNSIDNAYQEHKNAAQSAIEMCFAD